MIRTWSTACPDWESRIVAGQSLIPFPPLFPDQAEHALRIFRELVMVDAGNQTLGEISREWLLEFVGAIFGAYDSDAGRRLITEFFLLIAKKNSKSSSSAGIMLSALILNWRPSAEFFILAPTKEVADNSFFPARDAIRADPELANILHVQDHIRKITHRTSGASLKVIAADNETVSGKKGSGVLVDELWLFGKRPDAKNMLREALGGLVSRPEGFVIYLSTQSDDPPAGVFKEKLAYARDVRDGIIEDPQFLPVLYEFPKALIEAEAHLHTENFYISNPNLGASVDVPTLEREYRKAQVEGPDSLRGFLAKHLNIEIGNAQRHDRWAGAPFWPACGTEPGLTLEELIERSEVATIGIDGGGLDDLLGFTVLGRETDTGRWLSWSHAWVHPVALEQRKDLKTKYEDLKAEGTLSIVDRVDEDIEGIVSYIKMIEEAGILDCIGVDPAGIGSIVDALLKEGFSLERIKGVPQGWKLNGAIKTVERRLAGGTLAHSGSSLMDFCVSNARTELKGNALTISKAVSGKGKIDPLVALLCAAVLMMLDPQPKTKQYQMMMV